MPESELGYVVIITTYTCTPHHSKMMVPLERTYFLKWTYLLILVDKYLSRAIGSLKSVEEKDCEKRRARYYQFIGPHKHDVFDHVQ